MKIDRLDLIAYGPFTNYSLRFGEGKQGLHIVFGLNEAGKSSTLRALRDALFGIPARTEDAFLHPYPDLRIGLAISNGQGTLEFVRRKANVKSLRTPDDSSLIPDRELDNFLGRVDRNTFETMFGIDHKALVEGGRELAGGKGEIGQLLFAAGTGIADLGAIQAELAERAGRLFKSAGKTPVINQLLREIQDKQKELRESQVSVTAYQEHRKQLSGVDGERASVDKNMEALKRERDFLTRVSKALPIIARRKEGLKDWLEVRNAALLREGMRAELQKVLGEFDSARDKEGQARRELESIAADIAALRIPNEILAEQERIEKVYLDLGSVKKSREDLLRRQAEMAKLDMDIGSKLERLANVPMEQARELLPKVSAISKIRELIEANAKLQNRITRDGDSLSFLQQEQGPKIAAIRGLKPQPLEPVESILARFRKSGLAEDRRAKLQQAIHSTEAGVRAVLSALPLWQGVPEELECLATPLIETIESYQDIFRESEANLSRLRDKLGDAERELDEAGRSLSELERGREIPTGDRLLEARATREIGWQAVKRAWKEGLTDTEEQRTFLSAMAPVSDLATAYEAGVQKADSVADSLRIEANLVERKASLISQKQEIAERLSNFRNSLATAEQERHALEERWAGEWKGTGVEPRNPQEMLGWLRRKNEIVQKIRAFREQKLDADLLDEQITGLRDELSAGLVECGEPPAGTAETLFALSGRAQAYVDRVRGNEKRGEQLQEDLRRLQVQIAQVAQRLDQAKFEYEKWRTEWAAAVREIRLGPDASVRQAEDVLSALDALSVKLDERDGLDDRIRKMLRDVEIFESDVRLLASRLQPDLTTLSPDRAIEELRKALQQAKTDKKLLAAHRQNEANTTNRLKQAQNIIRESQLTLDQLYREAACDSVEALRHLLDLSEKRRKLETHLSTLQEQLILLTGGRTVDEFLQEAETVEPDLVNARLDNIERELHEFESKRDILQDRLIKLKQEETAMSGGDTAARVLEEIASLKASLSASVADYLRVRTAELVLRKTVERHREKNQGPVLERAGKLFSCLTGESFRELRLDLNESGQTVLLGVRENGKTVPLGGMSDGTLDQLYLALRLASLDHYCEENEPMPFIVDDVLVNFDDRRARAALRALAEVSARTQVVFFTHHRHLVQLAKQSLDSSLMSVHALGGSLAEAAIAGP